MEDILAEKRKEKGLTQQEFAKEIGVSRQYYNDLENNKRVPSVQVAKKIGFLLGVDWTLFFEN